MDLMPGANDTAAPTLILNWRGMTGCRSLGNIVSQALATEFIRDVLGRDVGVLVAQYHRGVWDLCVPQDRILIETQPDDNVYKCRPHRCDASSVPQCRTWVGTSVYGAGFEMHADHKLHPRVCWLHDTKSRTVLLYPREHYNQNQTFTLDYWIATTRRLKELGFKIAAILDMSPSHRDGDISVTWCQQYRAVCDPDYVLPPTIAGLQAAVSISSVAIGRGNGPAWLMLKSTIPQIVLDDPNDPHQGLRASVQMPQVAKKVRVEIGTSTDWLGNLGEIIVKLLPLVKTTIDGITMLVKGREQAAWDIGTSQAVITGDEYSLRPFANSPKRLEVRTVVDVGANIGAFTLAARRMFPNSRVIAIEPDPDNIHVLRSNCGDDEQVTICQTAVLNDGCPSTVHLCRHELNSGGSYVRELFQQKSAPFTDSSPIVVPCRSIHDLLVEMGVNVIDLLKVDAEGSEVEIFSCLADHGWLPKTCWIRFEWHGRESIPQLRRLLSPTHEVSIEEDGLWNALGIAHRKEIHDGVEC